MNYYYYSTLYISCKVHFKPIKSSTIILND
jgi:hypothetical protein